MSHVGTIQSGRPEEREVLYRQPRRAWGLLAIAALCGLLLAAGWRVRDEFVLVPESGLGYALGPAGLGMMTLLLLYSLRKRVPLLRNAGSVRTWFHVHMMLGLLGPTAIMLHANFNLGSLNSNVALVCMLAVSGSGIIGRFIYTRIHYEYFGRKARVVELRRDAEEGRNALGSAVAGREPLVRAIEGFERFALAPATGLGDSLWRAMWVGPRSARLHRRLRRALRPGMQRRERRDAERGLREYFRAARRVAQYGACERAFALWHAAHLPLCFLLFGAAAVHVVAVHMY